MKWVDSPPPADKRTPEEKAADAEIEKTYTRNKMKLHIERKKFAAEAIRVQREAMLALPAHLREEAMKFDYELPPPHPRLSAPREYPPAPKRLVVEKAKRTIEKE
eukprot:TRINITY_DN628_c0_g1_i2.p2 TRINITY_DN628_c0_g1~~TRINITY_DN628_c0_g1_i2.p2  ORF type:complete len:105 (+),score=40.98 TRINITY_DN628_c0_g1_i2:250-564(+)